MEPKDFLRVLLRRRRTVITAILIVVGVAMFGSMRKAPEYSASCHFIIKSIGAGGSGGSVSEDPKQNPTETYASFETMQDIIKSPIIAKRVAQKLNVNIERVLRKVSALNRAGTEIFDLQTIDGDPKFAADTCNAYALAFLEHRLDQAKERITAARGAKRAIFDQTRREAAQVKREEQTAVTGGQGDFDSLRLRRLGLENKATRLLEEIVDLETALATGLEGSGEIYEPASIGAKTGPDHKKDGILGLIIGLIFGSALALVREYMDDTVKDKEGAQRDLGLSVLGSMPFAKDGPGPDPDSIEAARTLRTNLLSQGLGNDLRVVVVTSTLAKRRATTLANLASAIAEAGRSVLVIGSDLRNPRTHEAFGIGNAVGLTNVIRGQVPFEKAIRQVPGMQGVYVMPAGPPVGSPGELLSTDQMSNLVDQAREWADVVLLDAPPVLSAADASVLGTYADGVLLVMSAGQTLRAQATEAKEQLGAAGARILGAVMFGGQAEPTQTGAGRILALPMLRRGGDDEDLNGLTTYGWDGAQAGSFGANYGYDGDSYDNYEQSLGNDYSDGFGTGQGNGLGNGYDSGYGNDGGFSGYGNGNGGGEAFGGYGNGQGNGYGNGQGDYGYVQPSWDDQEPVSSPRARASRAKPKTNGNGNGNGRAKANGNGNVRTNGRSNGKSNEHANGSSNGHANGKANGYSNGKTNGYANGNGRTNGNGHANGRTKAAAPNGRAKANGNGNGNGNGRAYSNGRTNGNGNGRVNGNGNGNGHTNGRNGGNSNGRNSLARTGNGNGNGHARTANGNRNGSARATNGNGNARIADGNGKGNGRARTANGNGNGNARTGNGSGNARTGNGSGNARIANGNGNGRSSNGYAAGRASDGNGKANGQPRTKAARPRTSAARRQYEDRGEY